MGMGLKQDQNLSNDANQGLTLSQEREIEVNQNRADLGNIETKLDSSLKENDVLSHYSQESKDVLMSALSKEVYIKHGENPDVRSVNDGISPTSKEYYIGVRIGEFQHASIKPENVLEEYAQKNSNFDLESGLREVEGSRQGIVDRNAYYELTKDNEAIQKAIGKAEGFREEQILQREKEINASKILGFIKWNAPESILTLEEKPISNEDVLKFLDPSIRYKEGIEQKIESNIETERNRKLPIEERKFDTPDLAISGSLLEINGDSIRDNREYGGLVCMDSNGKYFLSAPIMGGVAGVNPSNSPCLENGSKVVGDYHTHGNYSDSLGNPTTPDKDEYRSLVFSYGDLRGIENDGAGIDGYKGYLSTPNGTIMRYDPESKETTTYNLRTGKFE